MQEFRRARDEIRGKIEDFVKSLTREDGGIMRNQR
jgi:hypothetical protein